MKKLITIESLVNIPRRGILLSPDIPLEQISPPFPKHAILVSQLDTRRQVDIEFALMHTQQVTGYFCILKNISMAEIEIGSTVWVIEDVI
jgi:hypothetical protein